MDFDIIPAMVVKPFTSAQERGLLLLSVFGFLAPNGTFLYVAATDWAAIQASLSHPILLVLWLEAFILTGLFCWLIHRAGNPRPGWIAFLALSLIGSLACSVPGTLCLFSRNQRSSEKS